MLRKVGLLSEGPIRTSDSSKVISVSVRSTFSHPLSGRIAYDSDHRPRSSSRELNLIELRDLEFLCGTARQDRELMQGKFVLVIAAGDQAVYRDHAIVTERRMAAVAVYMTA